MHPVGAAQIPGLDQAIALVGYDDTSRPFIADVKYRGVLSSVSWFAAGLTELMHWYDIHPQMLCWVPANRANRRRRGFDQAQLLAKEIGQNLGVPTVGLISRVGSDSQTQRSRTERLAGPLLVGRQTQASRHVVVVDDVASTGASLRAAAEVVRALGAQQITAAVAALNR